VTSFNLNLVRCSWIGEPDRFTACRTRFAVAATNHSALRWDEVRSDEMSDVNTPLSGSRCAKLSWVRCRLLTWSVVCVSSWCTGYVNAVRLCVVCFSQPVCGFGLFTTSPPRGCEVLWWVCLSVCLSVRQRNSKTARPPNFARFLCTLLMAVARSSSDGFATCYVLPVLWMTSCFHCGSSGPESSMALCLEEVC